MADSLNAARKFVATHRPDSLRGGPDLIILPLVFPVLLGKGKRFFSDGTPPCELALIGTKTASSDVIISTPSSVF